MGDDIRFSVTHDIFHIETQRYDELRKRTRAEFGHRLRAIRTGRGMSQPQIASALGITKNAVTNWEAGTAMPDASNIAPLCALLQCTADDLYGLPRTDKLTSAETRHMELYRAISVAERRCVDNLMETMLDNRERAFRIECQRNYCRVPHISLRYSAGTGNPLEGTDDDMEYEYLRISRAVCMADAIATVSGDSMSPTFKDGDDLLIQRTESIEPGEIGLFVVAGDGFVKEYQRDGLHSHNPKYHTIRPAVDDNARCVGRVLGVITDDMRATEKESRILDEIYAG